MKWLLLQLILLPHAGTLRAAIDSVAWPSLRGGHENCGTASWAGSANGEALDEWHFRGRADRRFKQGVVVWASPAVVVVNDRPHAFIGGFDQTMHALDLVERKRVWFRITNGEILAPPAVGVVDGRQVVFWGSSDRTVYAHYADDGGLLWTTELAAPTSTMGETRLSAPLIGDGTIYINCFIHDKALARSLQTGWMYALDMADGSMKWRYEISQGPVSSPVGALVDGRRIVYAVARKGLLQAIDVSADVPRPLWTFQMPHETLGSPTLYIENDEALLFLGSKFGNLIAVDARTGIERWQRMSGNWIDNTVAVGRVKGRPVVFAGSHDYNLYAFDALDGTELWRCRLGGEIFSAPAFFHKDGHPHLAAATLDDRIYVVDAASGSVLDAFRTGKPVWDMLSKGEHLWGSPVALEYGGSAALVHGSYNNVVYVLPLDGDNSMRVGVRSPSALWFSMLIVLLVFILVILPPVLWLPLRGDSDAESVS